MERLQGLCQIMVCQSYDPDELVVNMMVWELCKGSLNQPCKPKCALQLADLSTLRTRTFTRCFSGALWPQVGKTLSEPPCALERSQINKEDII